MEASLTRQRGRLERLARIGMLTVTPLGGCSWVEGVVAQLSAPLTGGNTLCFQLVTNDRGWGGSRCLHAEHSRGQYVVAGCGAAGGRAAGTGPAAPPHPYCIFLSSLTQAPLGGVWQLTHMCRENKQQGTAGEASRADEGRRAGSGGTAQVPVTFQALLLIAGVMTAKLINPPPRQWGQWARHRQACRRRACRRACRLRRPAGTALQTLGRPAPPAPCAWPRTPPPQPAATGQAAEGRGL